MKILIKERMHGWRKEGRKEGGEKERKEGRRRRKKEKKEGKNERKDGRNEREEEGRKDLESMWLRVEL